MAIRAVLVGVDVYERSDVPRLNGCVNDAALVRWILKQYFGVPNEHVRLVVNERATKANIVHRLEAMVSASEPGDLLLFYFSGHGSQIRDRDGDELTDALDEVMCPYDMDWDRKTYLLDDDLDAFFAELPPDVVLEAFLDCCFWGAGTRDLKAEPRPQSQRFDVRYLPPPLDIAARAEGEEGRLEYHQLAGCECFSAQNVLWAATEEGYSAAEDYFDGRVHGIFTYSWCRLLEENIEHLRGWGYSREQLLADVRSFLGSLGYAQMPELTAPGDLVVARPLEPAAGWEEWIEAALGGPPPRGRRRHPRR